MKGLRVLCISLAVALSACAKEGAKSSEPIGKFEAEEVLDSQKAQKFSGCGLQDIAKGLDFSCAVDTQPIEIQEDKVETGLYTFTVNDQIVPSLKITRTIKALVSCKDASDTIVSKGEATETTIVIFASAEEAIEQSSCSAMTPVWMMKKVEANGEVLQKDTHQLLHVLSPQALMGIFPQ